MGHVLKRGGAHARELLLGKCSLKLQLLQYPQKAELFLELQTQERQYCSVSWQLQRNMGANRKAPRMFVTWITQHDDDDDENKDLQEKQHFHYIYWHIPMAVKALSFESFSVMNMNKIKKKHTNTVRQIDEWQIDEKGLG